MYSGTPRKGHPWHRDTRSSKDTSFVRLTTYILPVGVGGGGGGGGEPGYEKRGGA